MDNPFFEGRDVQFETISRLVAAQQNLLGEVFIGGDEDLGQRSLPSTVCAAFCLRRGKSGTVAAFFPRSQGRGGAVLSVSLGLAGELAQLPQPDFRRGPIARRARIHTAPIARAVTIQVCGSLKGKLAMGADMFRLPSRRWRSGT